jgi:hypothetical protein
MSRYPKKSANESRNKRDKRGEKKLGQRALIRLGKKMGKRILGEEPVQMPATTIKRIKRTKRWIKRIRLIKLMIRRREREIGRPLLIAKRLRRMPRREIGRPLLIAKRLRRMPRKTSWRDYPPPPNRTKRMKGRDLEAPAENELKSKFFFY